MFSDFSKSLRLSLARVLARVFQRLCNPAVERDLVRFDDYVHLQNIRRRHVERFLGDYLGPR